MPTRRRSLARRAGLVARRVAMAGVNLAERFLDPEALVLAGQTPHEVILRDDLLSVLHYPPLQADAITIGRRLIPVERVRHRVPLVCIPPLLAPGFAFDLMPDRSLVRYFTARGFRVYLIDFGSPGREHAHLSLEHYILSWVPEALEAVRAHAGGGPEVSLFGYCMGGLFSLLYVAATGDRGVRNLVTVASPIDMHQAGAAGRLFSVAALPAHRIAQLLHFSLRDVDPRLLHIPGELGTLAFYLTNPLGVIRSYWDLLLRLWDRDYLAEHVSVAHWVENLLDYPGAAMQELIVQMGLSNTLARKGSMRLGEHVARLSDVHCSMLAFAGEQDDIVPPPAARKILEVVSSEDTTFGVVPGGHVGLIIGSKAHERMWPIAADWLAERSG